MAGPLTVPNGALIPKDPTEKRVITFDWDASHLATGVTITTSTWTITCERPVAESPIALTNDNSTIVTGNRKTQTRLNAGTLGSRYRVTNHITTSESPAQEKEASCFVQMVDQ